MLGTGGAVAEWSRALLVRENKRKKQKEPRFAPTPLGNLKKVSARNTNLKTGSNEALMITHFAETRSTGQVDLSAFFPAQAFYSILFLWCQHRRACSGSSNWIHLLARSTTLWA